MGGQQMNKEQIGSLRMAITKVQALVKAVELSQRGFDTEESREVVQCMQTAHHLLESVYGELSRAQQTSEVFRPKFER